MTSHERLEAVRTVLSQLHEAQITAVLCVAQLKDLTSADDPVQVRNSVLPVFEEGTCCVCWKGCRCDLGHTTSYRLFVRLTRRINQYVSYDHLRRDVWDDRSISRYAVRSAIRELRAKLTKGKMKRLAKAIRGHGQHYGLILHPKML